MIDGPGILGFFILLLLVEAPRRPREGSMTPSRRIHFVYAPASPHLLRGAFV